MARSVTHGEGREKILTLEGARAIAEKFRAQGRRLVTVNGAFDLLHAGHLALLRKAKAQGDILVVGVNADASVREGKGEGRPVIPQAERAALLAALACVDYVVVVDAPYDRVPHRLLEAVRPHVHVNGSEYGPPEQWIEWPVMQAVGARGYVVRRRPGLATSDLIKKIKRLP